MPQSMLSKCVVTPSRLAKMLKWNNLGNIMGLSITRSRVAVAIAAHPSKNGSSYIRQFDPIPYLTQECGDEIRNMKKEFIIRELDRIAVSEQVCGFVVGWPLEPSSFPGSRCGQVLHLLDFLTEKRLQGKYLINNSRPVVLWDERIITHKQFDEKEYPQDEWGRSERFSQKLVGLDDATHISSLRTDHPTTDDSTAASLLLEQFFKEQSSTFGLVEDQCSGDGFQLQRTTKENEIDLVDVCASTVL